MSSETITRSSPRRRRARINDQKENLQSIALILSAITAVEFIIALVFGTKGIIPLELLTLFISY
jgi:hypothetical protein